MSHLLKIIFRADASLQIGTGHVMRCLTLAEELRRRNAHVQFVCRAHSGHLGDMISRKGFALTLLPAPKQSVQTVKQNDDYAEWLGLSQKDDALQTIGSLVGKQIDWVIVDHYSLDQKWETMIRSYAERIMVVDDLANRVHDCDLLLDQNLYADMETRYTNLVQSSCKLLLGPNYTLLRREFIKARKNLRTRCGVLKRILIFFSGTDISNETAKAIRAVKSLELQVIVDVVVGTANPHNESIKQECDTQDNFYFYEQTDKMATLMAQADLAIGAGGSTIWERCYLGLPAIVTILANNQEKLVNDVAQTGAVINLGWADKVSSDTYQQVLSSLDKTTLTKMSIVALSLLDGDGCTNVSRFLST